MMVWAVRSERDLFKGLEQNRTVRQTLITTQVTAKAVAAVLIQRG